MGGWGNTRIVFPMNISMFKQTDAEKHTPAYATYAGQLSGMMSVDRLSSNNGAGTGRSNIGGISRDSVLKWRGGYDQKWQERSCCADGLKGFKKLTGSSVGQVVENCHGALRNEYQPCSISSQNSKFDQIEV